MTSTLTSVGLTLLMAGLTALFLWGLHLVCRKPLDLVADLTAMYQDIKKPDRVKRQEKYYFEDVADYLKKNKRRFPQGSRTLIDGILGCIDKGESGGALLGLSSLIKIIKIMKKPGAR